MSRTQHLHRKSRDEATENGVQNGIRDRGPQPGAELAGPDDAAPLLVRKVGKNSPSLPDLSSNT